MSIKLMPGWDKPVEEPGVQRASMNLAAKALPFAQGNEFPFRAPHNCDLALTRGFYFSLRLPDWARDFKQQNREILGHSFDPLNSKVEGNAESLKQSKHYGDHRSERYGLIYSENPFFDGIPREKVGKVERLPKIKDDLTCGKRVSSAQTPLPLP